MMFHSTEATELMASDVLSADGGRSRVPSHKVYSDLDVRGAESGRSRVPSHKVYLEE